MVKNNFYRQWICYRKAFRVLKIFENQITTLIFICISPILINKTDIPKLFKFYIKLTKLKYKSDPEKYVKKHFLKLSRHNKTKLHKRKINKSIITSLNQKSNQNCILTNCFLPYISIVINHAYSFTYLTNKQ